MTRIDIPYQPRELSEKELTHLDVYLLRSPKARRMVGLVGAPCLAYWLEFEFDPTIEVCVERPRKLELHQNRQVEIDFWTKSVTQDEAYWVVLNLGDSLSTEGGYVPRDFNLWDRVMQRVGIAIKFLSEQELNSRAQRISNWIRILPYVQASRRNSSMTNVMGRIKELFGPGIVSLSFEQIELSLSDICRNDARIGACVLIHSGWLKVADHASISPRTRLSVGPR